MNEKVITRESSSSLVLIRGLLRESRHWGDFPSVLQNHLNQLSEDEKKWEILTPDLKGNGARFDQSSPSSILAMVDDLRGEVNRPGEKLWLVALSMGGMIAAEWANQYPEDIEGIVLINTSFSAYSSVPQRLRPENYSVIAQLIFLNHSIEEKESSILRMTSSYHKDDSQLLSEWLDYAKTAPVASMNALRQLWAAMKFNGKRRPGCPVLVVVGEGDQLVNPICSHEIAQHWGCPFVIHDTAGHDLPLDEPLWLAEQIDLFIQGEACCL